MYVYKSKSEHLEKIMVLLDEQSNIQKMKESIIASDNITITHSSTPQMAATFSKW